MTDEHISVFVQIANPSFDVEVIENEVIVSQETRDVLVDIGLGAPGPPGPPGIGSLTPMATLPRGEAISGSRGVLIEDRGDGPKVWLARASDPDLWATGFVVEAGPSGDLVDVWRSREISGLSGIVPGMNYFLGISGELVASPPIGAKVIQFLGVGITDSKVFASVDHPVFVED